MDRKYRFAYFLILLVAGLAVVIPTQIVPSAIRVPVLAVMLCALIPVLVLTINLAWQGNMPNGISGVILGSIFIVGGIGFDVIATLHYSPDLTRESNPIARVLLESNVPVEIVRVIGLGAQSALVIVLVAGWISFCKNLHWMVSQAEHVRSPLNVFVTLFAGPNATYADFLLGRGDPKWAYLSVSALLTLFTSYRWYLGFEWVGLVPISRVLAPSLIVAGAVVGYFLFFLALVRQERERERAKSGVEFA